MTTRRRTPPTNTGQGSTDATSMTRATGPKWPLSAALGGGLPPQSRATTAASEFAPSQGRPGNRQTSGLAANSGTVTGAAKRNAGVGRGAPGKVIPSAKRVGKGQVPPAGRTR